MKTSTLRHIKGTSLAALTVALVIGTHSTYAQTTSAPTYAMPPIDGTISVAGSVTDDTTSTASWTGYTPRGGSWYTSAGDLAVESRSQSVADLQGFLIEFGFLQLDPTVPLGYFGTLTLEALVHFQLSRGIPVTGRFDADTRTAISALIIERSTPTGSIPGTNSTGPVSNGYWYNGLWYNVPFLNATAGSMTNNPDATTTSGSSGTSTRRTVGFFSGNPTRDGFNGLSNGYWYNGAWYGTSSAVMNGTTSNLGGYWLNGVWYAMPNTSSNNSI